MVLDGDSLKSRLHLDFRRWCSVVWKALVVQISIMGLSACTTLQTVADITPIGVVTSIQSGDRIRLVTRDQKIYNLKVLAVTNHALTGVSGDRGRHEIPVSEIASLEKKVASDTTIAWILGILGGGVLIAIIADSGGSKGGGSGESY